MRVLIDTNVLIDVIAVREPFFNFSDKVIDLCRQEIIEGAIAAHSVLNIAYILRKDLTLAQFKEMILSLCEFLYIEPIDWKKIIRAIDDNNFSDFEDCLQMQCAFDFKADYIVTRDLDDFKSSEIPAITPEDFCKLLETEEPDDNDDC